MLFTHTHGLSQILAFDTFNNPIDFEEYFWMGSINPRHVQCGKSNAFVALSCDGKLYSWSSGGHARRSKAATSFQLQLPSSGDSSEMIVQVAMNPHGSHLLALTNAGCVYSWGDDGVGGRLGHGDEKPHAGATLKKIEYFGRGAGTRIVRVACGSDYSAAVSAVGALFTWGCGNYGVLGHNSSKDQHLPKLVNGLIDVHVVEVACGSSGDESSGAHTLALTDTGEVWSWGDGEHGKLGSGRNENVRAPRKLNDLSDVEVCKVFCSEFYSFALTVDARLYAWGKTSENFNDSIPPTLVPGLEHVTHVSAYGSCIYVASGGDKVEKWRSLNDLIAGLPSCWHTCVDSFRGALPTYQRSAFTQLYF